MTAAELRDKALSLLETLQHKNGSWEGILRDNAAWMHRFIEDVAEMEEKGEDNVESTSS